MNTMASTITVLGGGPAGYVAAIRAAQLGADVLLIEENDLGGVCLNQGCIPTKSLLQNSSAAQIVRKSKEYGIATDYHGIDWYSAWLRKERVVKNLRQGVDQLMKDNRIKLLKGKGKITRPGVITVISPDAYSEVTFKKLIIAVGSEPVRPDIPGIDNDGILTSNEAVDLTALPESLIILGAGVIGLEFAEMFNHAGTKVIVLELQDRVVYREDPECSEALYKILKRSGITIKLGIQASQIIKENGLIRVLASENGVQTFYTAEKLLIASGRKPRSKGIGLENTGIRITDSGAIPVNTYFETENKGVYAVGDVTGGRQLAHLAYAQGKAAAENALGFHTKIDETTVPACIYTHPELAAVGISQAEAESKGIPIITGRFNFRQNGRAQAIGQRDGFVKVIIHKESHVVLGGLILGEHASEMISGLTLAITLQVKAEVMADMIYPHPTLSEAIQEACADALGRSIHKSEKSL